MLDALRGTDNNIGWRGSGFTSTGTLNIKHSTINGWFVSLHRAPPLRFNQAVSLRFRSVIEIEGINPFVLVKARQAARIQKGWRKPLPVRVRVNGKPEKAWRINLMPVGDGSFYLYLHGDVRKVSKAKVGDTVTVELEFDDEYKRGPAHPMPSWFSEALAKNRNAKRAWKELIPSRQKEILRYFSWLKKPESQVRNAQRAIQVLSGGKARFMGRAWNE